MNTWVNRFSWHAAEFGFEARTPALPTNSEPGSAARVALYRERLENGQPLHVEGDRLGARPALAYSDPPTAHSIVTEGDHRRGCAFDDHCRHRYSRWFRFNQQAGRHVVIIGQRPDDELDKRYAAWSLFHKFNRLSIVNLYSTRSAGNIVDIVDHIGPLIDLVMTATIADASIIVLAWGNQELPEVEIANRGAVVAHAIRKRVECPVVCFGLDKWQQPLPMQMSMPLVPAPLLRGEKDLTDD